MGASLSYSARDFAVNAREYYQQIQNALSSNRLVITSDMSFNEVDVDECYIRGSLTLLNSFRLHIAEYTITAPVLNRIKYRYHLQKLDGTLVSRWDNVPHHPHIATFPHHCHDAHEDIHPSAPMDILAILKVLPSFIIA